MELDEDPTTEPDPLGDWRMPYLNYLLHERLSTDKTKSFVLIGGEHYRRSHIGILQRCIPIKQEKQLLTDIHDGVYEHHAAHRTLVGNVFRQGLY